MTATPAFTTKVQSVDVPLNIATGKIQRFILSQQRCGEFSSRVAGAI